MSAGASNVKPGATGPGGRDLENFCFYPFSQLLLSPTGSVTPCCWNQDYVLGHVPRKTLREIWNDEPARKLRQEFLDGKPVSCAQQMRHIQCHRWSRRSYQAEIPLRVVQEAGPRRLDVRLNGRCNLQCVMCDVWKQPNGLYDQSDFWTLGPTEIFPQLREIDVLGGEPFVQADTYRLIDEISAVNPACTWAFVTNGQYKVGDAIRSRLDKIAIRWFQVSIDSVVPETYAKIRVKGDLSKTLKAVDDFLEIRRQRLEQGRPFRFIVSMCVQQANWKEIGEFLLYAFEHRVEPILQFAFKPDSTSLLYLGDAERREILGDARRLATIFGDEHLHPVVAPLQDSLMQTRQEPETQSEARAP